MKALFLVVAALVTACGFGGSASAARILNGLSPNALVTVASETSCADDLKARNVRIECARR